VIERLDRRASIALVATGALLVAGIATRLARPADPGDTPNGLLPLLVSIAAWLGALLLAPRAPGVAWPAIALAAILAVREPVALAGTVQRPGVPAEVWLPAAVLVGLTAATATGVAALYATRDARAPVAVGPGAWALVTWQALAACLSIGLGLARRQDDPTGPPVLHALTLPVGAWPVLPLLLVVVGALLDLRGPVRRAVAGREPASRSGDLPGLAGALGDELLGRAASRRATERRERARLAADLHADVLPELRAAVAELEAGRDPAVVGTRLAGVAAELQALTLERRNLIVEQLGLVPALEALAERIEARGGSTVEIDVVEPAADRFDPPGPARPAAAPPRPPAAVEKAALRIAELAVVNAAQHGSGPVRVSVLAGPTRVRLEIANPGPPFDPAAAREAIRRGARGLTEMREAAAEIDADLEIGGGPRDGAVVRLDWPRA
jgi:two-component system sensor histidine kinase UhpB